VRESERDGLFAVRRFDDRAVRRKLALKEFAQIAALRYIVFGYQNCHPLQFSF
jgi:hypothetical protein